MRWRYLTLIFPFLSLSTSGYSDPIPSPVEQLPNGAELQMKNKHVLISGAGIAGLTLAYWLKQYGFIPTLMEKHPTLRTGGYKVDIRGVAVEVVRRMGAYDSIFEARTDIQGSTIVEQCRQAFIEHGVCSYWPPHGRRSGDHAQQFVQDFATTGRRR